jgi:hypothetical protein
MTICDLFIQCTTWKYSLQDQNHLMATLTKIFQMFIGCYHQSWDHSRFHRVCNHFDVLIFSRLIRLYNPFTRFTMLFQITWSFRKQETIGTIKMQIYLQKILQCPSRDVLWDSRRSSEALEDNLIGDIWIMKVSEKMMRQKRIRDIKQRLMMRLPRHLRVSEGCEK